MRLSIKNRRSAITVLLCTALAGSIVWPHGGLSATDGEYLFNDSHVHLTNYVQQGPSVREYIKTMGDTIGRSVLFGIPLQQTWAYANSGDFAPTYYLQTDAPLYYYSFTDAHIAQAYLSLPPEDRQRLDPMITGFNPADMYGVDHIRRVLETFPGVFTGIGEFSIHKEFVSSKVAGNTALLTDPALDRILAFAGEVGLLTILHTDIDTPFAPDTEPVYLKQTREVLVRHPNTTIIWAHTGLGRVVQPPGEQATIGAPVRNQSHVQMLAALLEDPAFRHVHFDISWDEVVKYAISTPEVQRKVAALFNRFTDRFLFGTDVVAAPDSSSAMRVFKLWEPIFSQLTPEASLAIRKGNYERLFDAARVRVRAWEAQNVKGTDIARR